MRKIFFILLIFISSFTYYGCSKQSDRIIENTNQTNIKTEKSNAVYNHFGQTIDRSMIDFDNSDLTLVYGYTQNPDEILIFFNNDELISWAKDEENGSYIIETLNNIAIALAKAKEMGEFEYAEKYGDISDEYKEFLKSLVHNSGTREVNGVTNLFEDFYYKGDDCFIGVPRWSLGSFNKKASSIQFTAAGTTLFAKKWWRGAKSVFFTVFYGQDPDLRNVGFNDKTCSVWIW